MTEHTFTRKNDRLAIVGSHRGTRDGAPYDDPTWDIWVFNEAAQNAWVKRWTGVFNIHQEKNLQATNGIGSANHWEWLQKDHGEDHVIWTQKVDERIPNSVAYPKEEMEANFSPYLPNGDDVYATCTPAHALALGLYLGYKTIHTWGIDLGSNTEYTYQAPGWRYWWGVAKGMLGDNARIISGGEHLFKAKVYGYDDDTRSGPDFYKKRVEFHDAYWATSKKRCDRLKSAITDVMGGKGEPKDFMPLFKEAYQAYTEHGKCTGAMGEAQRFAERADILHRQEFEWHAAKAQEETRKFEPEFWKTVGHLEYVFNMWAQNRQFEARNQVMQFLDRATQLAYNLGFLRGKSEENVYYINQFDQMLVSASGGELSDEVLAAQNTEIVK